MALDININSKIYKIGCSKDDEEKIIKLSETLNTKIGKIKNTDPKFFMALNNETLLLFTALTLLEEIESVQPTSPTAEAPPIQAYNNIPLAAEEPDLTEELNQLKLIINSALYVNEAVLSINHQLSKTKKV